MAYKGHAGEGRRRRLEPRDVERGLKGGGSYERAADTTLSLNKASANREAGVGAPGLLPDRNDWKVLWVFLGLASLRKS